MEDIDTIEPSWEATFVPLDPPRASYFALWDPADVGGLPMARSDSRYKPIDVALVVPFGSGPLRTAVAARRLPIRDAIEVLGGRSVRQSPPARSRCGAPFCAQASAWWLAVVCCRG
ncbi:MAG: hypothetical protein R2710_11975 [Acidimicrobiales bacterium]